MGSNIREHKMYHIFRVSADTDMARGLEKTLLALLKDLEKAEKFEECLAIMDAIEDYKKRYE